MGRFDGVLYLFDVDGTITGSRKKIEPWMQEFMSKVRGTVTCGLVGGSDLVKISEQLDGREETMKYEYVFSENGLVAHKNGKLIGEQSILKACGEDLLQRLLNFGLKYMSNLTIPAKRGQFIEFRTGMINFCPVGRSCSQAERDEFSDYDKVHNIRTQFVDAMKAEFSGSNLVFAIGGQISIDVYPSGWDKTFCLQFVENDFKEIYFFGDKTMPGGNDHAIYEDSRTKGFTVTSPEDMRQQVGALLGINFFTK